MLFVLIGIRIQRLKYLDVRLTTVVLLSAQGVNRLSTLLRRLLLLVQNGTRLVSNAVSFNFDMAAFSPMPSTCCK